MTPLISSQEPSPRARRLLWLPPLALALILVATRLHGHVLFHTLAEIFAVGVALLAGVVAWNTHPFSRSSFLIYLGVGYLFIGALDLMHALTYKGTGIFPDLGSDISIQLWVGTRYLEALLMLTAPLFLSRALSAGGAVALVAPAAALVGGSIALGLFPTCFVEGSGLTPFKVYSEYVIILLLVGAAGTLWSRRRLVDPEMVSLMMLCILFTIAAEFCFTLYSDLYAFTTVVGHLFKLAAYWMIFVAVVDTTLTEPFRVLARGASTYDAIPDATVVVDKGGFLRQTNRAARNWAGLDNGSLLGRHCHEVYHPRHLTVAQCPVCMRLLAAEPIDLLEVEHRDEGRWVQYTLSPIAARGDLSGMVHICRDVTERHWAEEGLRRWAHIFEHAEWGVAVADREARRFELLNPAYARMHGYTPEELVGAEVSMFFPPDALREMPAHIARARETGHYLFESVHLRKDGSQFPVAIDVSVVKDSGGEPAYCAVHVKDITSQRAANEALRRSEERFRTLVETTSDWVWEVDEAARYTYSSPRVRDLLGYEPEEVVGRHPWEFMEPEEAARIQRLFAPLARDRLPMVALENVNLHRDGSRVVLETNGFPFFDGEGNFRGYRGIDRDITERKRAEQALRTSEARLAEAELIAHLGSWSADLQSGGAEWSEEQYRILGYEPGEVESTWFHFFEAAHPDDLHLLGEAIDRLLQGESDIFDTTFRIRRRDGAIRHVSMRGKAYRNGDGNAVRLVGASLDITDAKLAEQEILKLNAELEQRVEERTRQLQLAYSELESFAYSVSHDLRAPLRSIDGFSQLVLRRSEERLDATARDYLQRVRAAAARMERLISEILKLSRVARAEVHRHPVDLTALAWQVIGEVRQGDPERQVEFRVREGMVAEADEQLLYLVLFNLVGNAWKFTSRTPLARIEVGQGRDGDFFVRDNGAGFDMTYGDKLFTPFQRLHGEEEFEGYGIGLATVQRVIQRHRGRVWAEGEPGKGAIFHFTLGTEMALKESSNAA